MYDPLELGRQTARIVCRGTARKYYRFRPARFYGGIATADCLGCNLRCAFCWAWEQLHQVQKLGQFYEAKEVAERLAAIARKKGFSQVRLSGNEPTLGMTHLIEVLRHLPQELAFILETNGIILGAEAQWAKELAVFPQVFARVSLKGCTPEEFSHLTGAVPEGFALQLKALEHLLAAGIDCHAAVMVSFSPAESRERLRHRLASIHPALGDFEQEELILYPAVAARLTKRGLSCFSGYLPGSLP
ncbi:MAG: radical SAM protein [Deltaproteobacteria bacterium]|nr:radical SAM protein [Deltaproteobacteria bacterium]